MLWFYKCHACKQKTGAGGRGSSCLSSFFWSTPHLSSIMGLHGYYRNRVIRYNSCNKIINLPTPSRLCMCVTLPINGSHKIKLVAKKTKQNQQSDQKSPVQQYGKQHNKQQIAARTINRPKPLFILAFYTAKTFSH